MKTNASGKIGSIYTTQTGLEVHDLAMDEGELEEGWEQISPTERRRVVRKRISHTAIAWCDPEEK